eukprot:scaffold2644_cov339-Prasinococcus_capsulatus_cf.AAC.2
MMLGAAWDFLLRPPRRRPGADGRMRGRSSRPAMRAPAMRRVGGGPFGGGAVASARRARWLRAWDSATACEPGCGGDRHARRIERGGAAAALLNISVACIGGHSRRVARHARLLPAAPRRAGCRGRRRPALVSGSRPGLTLQKRPPPGPRAAQDQDEIGEAGAAPPRCFIAARLASHGGANASLLERLTGEDWAREYGTPMSTRATGCGVVGRCSPAREHASARRRAAPLAAKQGPRTATYNPRTVCSSGCYRRQRLQACRCRPSVTEGRSRGRHRRVAARCSASRRTQKDLGDVRAMAIKLVTVGKSKGPADAYCSEWMGKLKRYCPFDEVTACTWSGRFVAGRIGWQGTDTMLGAGR